ncbi:MAG: DUF4918 family protein [Owenweeksia sp.]|nr:DUF4918 family protein [Owenweeksia sp.]
MALAKHILDFYHHLALENQDLPADVKVMNPYTNTPPEIAEALSRFYNKFYNDDAPRGLILGINPGRFGAGVTGIPFTDSYRLKEYCGIPFPSDTRETSALFVYDVIEAYGGARKFYKNWFIGAVSPLGFIHKNNRGNWVNCNYYDQPALEQAVRPFIIEQLSKQKALCGNPAKCVVLGTGKNFKYLQKLNNSENLFEQIIPLEHPRYIMQYKLKSKQVFIEKYLNKLSP